MQVKDLKKILDAYPDEAFVAIEDDNCNWIDLPDNVFLETMWKMEEASNTYWDFCDIDAIDHEDWVWYTKVQVVMFRQ